MKQYTLRRRRCWNSPQQLRPDITVSECHRADMLLDLLGLDRDERITVQASDSNARDFDRIADALVAQHPRFHVAESRRRTARAQRKESLTEQDITWTMRASTKDVHGIRRMFSSLTSITTRSHK